MIPFLRRAKKQKPNRNRATGHVLRMNNQEYDKRQMLYEERCVVVITTAPAYILFLHQKN